jgi:hypothetical protein
MELLLTLKNSGTINANASSSPIIDTGTSSGGLDIQDNVNNFKTIGPRLWRHRNTAAAVIEALGSGADVQLNDAVILGGVLKTSGSNATIEALSDTDEMAAAPPLPAPLRSTTGLH